MILLEEFRKFAMEFMDTFNQYQEENDAINSNLHKMIIKQQLMIDELNTRLKILEGSDD